MSTADELDDFLVHTVTVVPLIGSGGMGDVHGPPVTGVPCFVDASTRMVRDRTGTQVVSSATVLARTTAPDAPPGSLLTLPSGRTSVVLAQARRESGPLDLPDHVEWAVE
ncbi:hypothetical protein G8C93_00805 [Cellulosimicrobium cellulans]|uniref:hypothetical protein n=1 Tax=Cellulosimicrobium cellulans TaxID=1710 RepID=UPI001883D137|nr:hypothetical protein [Cellulosimicrobium cellulans]MBE9924431.1 hypothetical protein [Cellulosimicrobium cellulans]